MLPDDALIAIFDFCVDKDELFQEDIEAWQTLVHVCRRWRTLVFGSPRRLNLRLVCAAKTPARDALDVWPALPLIIQCDPIEIGYMDNIVAALERNNRVCQIRLDRISSSDLEKCSAAMEVPFPELTQLGLKSEEKTVPVLPDSFLGRSAPHLRILVLRGIPFPGLPRLLLSATHLVTLRLYRIPHSGYFSPEMIVTALSMLTALEELWLGFESPRSCPTGKPDAHPPTRIVLPVMTSFWFKGVTEYLEDLVACIDAPRLGRFEITFFNDIVFDTPQLIQFIGRTPTLLNALKNANVTFADGGSKIRLSSERIRQRIGVGISCRGLDWQISSVEQLRTSCLPPIFFTLETLYIVVQSGRPERKVNVENTQWLELLHPFTAVKKLYLTQEAARRIAPALQELDGDRTTEVLPALENIFLDRPKFVEVGIEQFVATRQVTGHSITVSPWIGRSNPVHQRRR